MRRRRTSIASSSSSRDPPTRERARTSTARDLLSAAGASDPLAGLDRLVARGHEVWVFHVMHPDELELPYEDAARFLGLEGEEALEVEPQAFRESYLAELRAFLGSREERVVSAGARYRLVRTDEPVEHALAAMLTRRGGARWA